ncbi:hypothetical protein RYX36_009184 [Vicia faba]
MKPTFSQGCYKTCVIAYFDDKGSDYYTFINIDVSQRFSKYFFGMHALRAWLHFGQGGGKPKNCWRYRNADQGKLPFNTQIMKEFYSNLVDTNNKRVEVVVRGVKGAYAEGNININFHLKYTEDRYQEMLEALDDDDFDVFMESL